MTVKRTIHEICPQCGERQAKRLPNGSVQLSHNYKRRAPGPPNPPRTFRPGEVIFVHASGEVEG